MEKKALIGQVFDGAPAAEPPADLRQPSVGKGGAGEASSSRPRYAPIERIETAGGGFDHQNHHFPLKISVFQGVKAGQSAWMAIGI